MAKKPAKPARKSKPKPKATSRRAPSATRKGTAKSRHKPAARKASSRTKPANKKPSRRAVKKTASRKTPPKAVKKTGTKAKAVAKKLPKAKAGTKPVGKQAKPMAPTKVANGKQMPPLKAGAKPAPVAKGTPVAKPGAPVAVAAHKPTAGEIAAKLAGKRAEDATKKGKNGKHAELAPRELTPADVEARKRRLKTLIVLGKERGFLTYAEINDHLPDDILDAEQIEGVISMIGDMGIQVFDQAPDADTLLMAESPAAAPKTPRPRKARTAGTPPKRRASSRPPTSRRASAA